MSKYTRTVLSLETIDVFTGELIRIQELKIKKKDYDVYMKFYHNSTLNIDLTPTELKFLLFIDKHKTFNSSEVFINSALLNKFEDEKKVSKNSSYSCIRTLRQKKVLIRLKSGREFINPVYAWSGFEDQRETEIKKLKELFENDI